MTRLIAVAVLVAAFLLSPFACGAEVKVEGVLKEVDATLRTLTVERKTADGTKKLSLKVAEDAGDLASLKIGNEVTLACDSTLELVTKIVNVINSIGIALVEIPAGSFTMGSPSDERGREPDEEPVQVTLERPFLLGMTEVTQGQWKRVMNSEPWKTQPMTDATDDCPATSITFVDAMKFCEKLTEIEREKGVLASNVTYRLPTEAEWEYACRAGTTTAFSFGNESQINGHAWTGAWQGPASRQLSVEKVAMKKPNPWGMYDMHGNAFEWCSDWYDRKLLGGGDPTGPAEGSYRVSRGGCWWGDPVHCRSAYRFSFVPTREFKRQGLRVVRSESIK